MRISINRNIVALTFVMVILALAQASCKSAPSPSPSSNQGAATALSPQDEIKMRQNVYMSVLREEGYAPRIDNDGDIELSWQGNTYYLMMPQTDPSFVYLLLPLGAVDTNEALQKVAVAIGNADRNAKVAKAYLVGTNTGRVYIHIGAELFLEDPSSLRAVISRMLDSVDTVAQRIINEMS
jgi:hypothetical protein